MAGKEEGGVGGRAARFPPTNAWPPKPGLPARDANGASTGVGVMVGLEVQTATTTPKAGAPAPATTIAPVHTTGVVVNPTPTRPAVTPPHATVFSENSSPRRDQTVYYYLPVGAISPRSGLRTYPGHTAATITHGATRVSSGIPGGSTVARPAGSNGRPSTKAPTVSTR